MAEFAEEFREIAVRYMEYLINGGEPVELSHQKRQGVPGYVHASNMMDCPLRAMKEESKATPIFPKLAKENNPAILQRMIEGTKMGELFQEAMVWGARVGSLDWTLYESKLVNDSLKLVGNADLVYRPTPEDKDNEWNVITEIKHRTKDYKGGFPQPRMGDVFQLLAYVHMMEEDIKRHEVKIRVRGQLVIANTPNYAEFFNPVAGFRVWHLIPRTTKSGWKGYELVNEFNETWADDNNNPKYINIMALEDEIARQAMYMNGVTDPPIQLHEQEAWQCRKITKAPAGNKLGTFRVMCPHWCHPYNPQENYEFTKASDGTFQVVDF